MQRADTAHRRPARGITLVEMVVVLLVMAVLATLAYPSWRSHWLKARRGDARIALQQLQQAQVRWRADHPAYATAAELGAPEWSPHRHYRLAVRGAATHGFELQAEAQGAQQADVACAVLRVRQAEADTQFLSGPDPHTENPEPANRGCWHR